MNDKRYWVGFNLVKGIGAVRLQALRDHFGDLALAWQAPRMLSRLPASVLKLAERVAQVRSGVDLDKYLAKVIAQGIRS